MQVPIVKKWEEASAYLDMLAYTVVMDVLPLLSTAGGAPHTIVRQVFSYLDYLGALYVGTVDKAKIDGRTGLPQVSYRFMQYLDEVMRLTDSNYGKQKEAIYQMYRNGPVHEFDPKVLKNSRDQQLQWLIYRGQRHDSSKCQEGYIEVRHLEPVQRPHEPNKFFLPVSTPCLAQDLLNSLEYFKRDRKKARRKERWNSVAKKLNEPVTGVEFSV